MITMVFGQKTVGQFTGIIGLIFLLISLHQTDALTNHTNSQQTDKEYALGSRRVPPKLNTYLPNPHSQPKRLGNSINRNGYNPSGRVDAIPPLNDIDIGNSRNRYDNAPPNPHSPQRPAFNPSSSPQKSAPPVSAPRIQQPYMGPGYIDASTQGRSSQPRDLQGKIDGLREPNRLLSPSIQGTKIDGVGGRRNPPPPPQRPTRPQNPYAHEQRPFRTGREYLNAQKTSPRSDQSGQSKIQFGDSPRDNLFSNAHRNPSFNHNAQKNTNGLGSARGGSPNRNSQTSDPYNNAQGNNAYINNRNPTSSSNNRQHRNPPPPTSSSSSFNNGPKSRDPYDYNQRYNDNHSNRPQRPPHHLQSNSSFDNPRNGPFPPPNGQSKPQTSSNDPNSIPSLPAPFEFQDILKRGRDFPFQSSSSLGARPQRPRPSRNYGPSDLFQEFPNPLESYGPASKNKGSTDAIPQQRSPVASVAPSYRDNIAITSDPRYSPLPHQQHQNQDPRGRGPIAPEGGRNGPTLYGNNAANGAPPVYGGRGQPNQGGQLPPQQQQGQCFRYSFPSEAYRLSDLAKEYPQEAIQKEIDANPYLSPLVGQDAKMEGNDPFTFNAPISSHFDFSGFGFKNDATTSDKYNHLKNVKAYPGNLQQGDIVGRYPSSMQPLDSACPSREFSLKSFFHRGGDCFVVNPDFQQITYHRCTRQDCNFCGVNRGLSACVEEYRWVSVMAYCKGLPENKRIAPMRLLLPTGCSCQHFVC